LPSSGIPVAKVYVVRVVTARATPIAENVHTQAEAELAVNAFLAGYRERSQEPSLFRGDGPRHYRMTAETGKLGITGQNQ